MTGLGLLSRRQFVLGAGTAVIGLAGSGLVTRRHGLLFARTPPAPPDDIKRVMVAGEEGRFLGWPASNGLWTWEGGRELLVGYVDSPWVYNPRGPHHSGLPHSARLARSLDGGHTWTLEHPANFVDDEGEPQPSPGEIDFGHPDFAFRTAASGYQGSANDTVGRFFFSLDRGHSWHGPYRFNGLNADPRLEGMVITARTDYLVTGPSSALIMMSATRPGIEHATRLDKAFVAETDDAGTSFRFVSWVVPWTDQYRAVMPSTVRLGGGQLVAALRRRNPRDDEQPCWVDTYASADDGRTWSFRSWVGETGLHNGNPPALTVLADRRLACVYANRSAMRVVARFSADGGTTWSPELVIRETLDTDGGYPRVVQNHDGDLVAIYFTATQEHRHSFIEAAIWTDHERETLSRVGTPR